VWSVGWYITQSTQLGHGEPDLVSPARCNLPGPLSTPPGPPRKPPSSYRPDLRPMLILVAVLAAIVIGWIILSPIILPPPAR
jgi:hypothetical protein